MEGGFLLIRPDTWFRAVWDWVVILFVLYSAVVVPLEISFGVRTAAVSTLTRLHSCPCM